MNERPQIDLPVQAVCCAVHGEVFRQKWPSGYLGFAITVMQKALETSAELHEATGGRAERLNAVIAEFGPLCRLVDADDRLAAYMAGAEISKDWAQRGICAACRKWKLGALGTFRTPVGLIDRHVCFECVSGQACQ